MAPSPRAHIYRLVLLLLVALLGFLGVKQLATPSSWDHAQSYRADALPLLREQPVRFGGNASCDDAACHDQAAAAQHHEQVLTLQRATHRGVACESCHGSLARHVEDGKKVAPARVDRDSTLCLGCHAVRRGRDSKISQFDPDFIYHRLMGVESQAVCWACHEPHEPK